MKFWKYQGAGNDFILIDQRVQQILTRNHVSKIAELCHRRFGIGADGLILLQNHPEFDFEMVYFNADGNESTMCGNGGRCIAAFAGHLGIVRNRCRFWAIDGEHEAVLNPTTAPHISKNRIKTGLSWVDLKMSDVSSVEQHDNVFILNTGSPHYVRFVDKVENLDMVAEGRAVRYSERFKNKGINVNLVAVQSDGSLHIRTYERGVEDETLACGTGVTAAALAYSLYNNQKTIAADIPVFALGGPLRVRFQPGNLPGVFSNIWLCGPAKRVFEGETIIDQDFIKYL